jgi:hypothetical protein
MNPKEIYDRIIASITEIDKRRVARTLSQHVGKANAIAKRDLVGAVFGKFNDSTERKTREIIAELVTSDHFAVCALSGTGGYYLAANLDEAIESARELESRGTEAFNRAKALRMCGLPAVSPDERAQKSQMSLL